MTRNLWRTIIIFVGIFLITLLGTSIIFDIIFYISKWYPHFILRLIIIYLIFEAILKFTSFGKEFEKSIKLKPKLKWNPHKN